jgi:hypothetical protein
MEFFLQNLGINKVVLEIKTNRFEESYHYNNDTYDRFDKIEDIGGLYKEKLRHSREPAKPLRPPCTTAVHTTSDAIICNVLHHLDPSLTLISDKAVFVDKFKSDLRTKLPNYKERLKKYGITDMSSVIKEIDDTRDTNRPGLMRYLTILLEKSIAVQTDTTINIYPMCLNDKCIFMKDDTFEEISLADCYERFYEMRKSYHTSQGILNKLESFLVKDLKQIAEEIGLQTFKLDENNKKKPLLKAELKEKIMAALADETI